MFVALVTDTLFDSFVLRSLYRHVGYNVANSEYQRFSNVLARFEAEKMVGTSKAKDSLQVFSIVWYFIVCKFTYV